MPSSPASDAEERGGQPAATEEAPPQAGPNGELEELRERNAELDDRYKRALADLDNYRKRAARDVERRVAEGREAAARQWLDAVDSVERALQAASPENPLAAGLRAVLEQMEAILERQGVTRMGSRGEQFDPERHEAVGVVESAEAPDQSIVEVPRSGYMLGDRVLRPAQVVVARRAAGER
jgi:molecular chaperone GrpE